MASVAQLRRYADLCRELADRAENPERKQALRRLVDEWTSLADESAAAARLSARKWRAPR
jgi:hypothetical protein